MQTHKAEGLKARFIIAAIFLILYLASSAMVGFPLGFGRIMARDIVKDYCNVIYPEAIIEKTVFNPVNSVFETEVYLGEEKIYISTMPNRNSVGDNYRSEVFLQEAGVTDTLSRLHRTYVSGNRYYRFLACNVYWNYDDPMTPIAYLRFDYADYENSNLPNDEHIKEILTPIVLDCILQVEEHLTLDSIKLLYYHPDFYPNEKGKTWRIIDMPLDDDTPRTKDLLDDAQFSIS
ncbi:MAG: hypothetical protein GX154_11350 [Clostridiales bacterium]|nr:hypothetical protein [Clostridiales bacterium]